MILHHHRRDNEGETDLHRNGDEVGLIVIVVKVKAIFIVRTMI